MGGVLMGGIFVFLLILSSFVYSVEQAPAVNMQTMMTSASMSSFGNITPYQTKEIGNVMINPASIADIKFQQLTISSLQLNKQIDYRHLSYVFPYQNYSFSLSLGTNVTSGFDKTIFVDDRIYSTGAFSSGFDVLHVAVGQKYEESFYFVDHFSYGIGMSVLTQVIGTKRRQASFGFDLGAIGTTYMDKGWVNRVDMGVSVINALSTDLPEWKVDGVTAKASSIERQLYAGAKAYAFDYTTGVHVGVRAQGDGVREFMGGVDYKIGNSLTLRGSMIYDNYQSQDLIYNMGTGILLQRVAGFSNQIFDMSVDYNLAIYPAPRVDDQSHTISVSFYGQSSEPKPIVLSPSKSFSTAKPFVSFSGKSDRNATLYLYNGKSIIRKFASDNNGKWSLDDVRLLPGYNSFTFRSKTKSKDLSVQSKPLVVYFDQVAPTFETELNIGKNSVYVELTANESLGRAELIMDGKRRKFKRLSDKRYSIKVGLPDKLKSGRPFPNDMVTADIIVKDKFGNRAPTESVSFFVKPIFPYDQSIIYNDSLTVLGYGSPYVNEIFVNDELIEVDEKQGFAKSVQLDYGKQLVVITLRTKNNQVIRYYARLICMRRFEDIPKSAKYRRDVEFLASFGFVFPKDDGLFHPEDEMTRREIALSIAKYKKLEPKTLTYDPFLDISVSDPDAGLLAKAVEEGIIYGFSDGTFRADELVSVEEAFRMLNNSDVIDSEDVVVNPAAVTRVEFALMFKLVPRYDQRVVYLMDWEQGYELPK